MFQPRLCTFTLCEDPARASSISTVPCEPGGLRRSTASPRWGEGRDPLQRARLPPGSLEGGLLGFSWLFFGPLLPGTELVFWDWAPGGVKQRHVAVLGIRSPCLQLYFRAAASGRCTTSQLSSPPYPEGCPQMPPHGPAEPSSPYPSPPPPPPAPRAAPSGCRQPGSRPLCSSEHPPKNPSPAPFRLPSAPNPPRLRSEGGSRRLPEAGPPAAERGPGRAHPRRPCRSPGAAAGARGLPPARGAAER